MTSIHKNKLKSESKTNGLRNVPTDLYILYLFYSYYVQFKTLFKVLFDHNVISKLFQIVFNCFLAIYG